MGDIDRLRPQDIVGSAAVLGLGGVRQDCLRWKHLVGCERVRRLVEICKRSTAKALAKGRRDKTSKGHSTQPHSTCCKLICKDCWHYDSQHHQQCQREDLHGETTGSHNKKVERIGACVKVCSRRTLLVGGWSANLLRPCYEAR